jgi:uncharacterized lipoprotein YajG
VMKPSYVLFTFASVVMLASCAAPKPNPEFRECANACTKRQDACMVSASTSADVSRCNTGLDACVASCERKFPRYLQP